MVESGPRGTPECRGVGATFSWSHCARGSGAGCALAEGVLSHCRVHSDSPGDAKSAGFSGDYARVRAVAGVVLVAVLARAGGTGFPCFTIGGIANGRPSTHMLR